MTGFSLKLSRNYALDVYGFYVVRALSDGVAFLELTVNFDFFKADHNPKFKVVVILLNLMILDLCIYNVNHIKDDPQEAL